MLRIDTPSGNTIRVTKVAPAINRILVQFRAFSDS
jgi:hypothetical protein